MNTTRSPDARFSLLRGLVGSIILAIVLIAIDVLILGGYFLISSPVCLIWFPVAIARSLIWRKNWPLAISRILIPVVTLWLTTVLGNVPDRFMQADARLIIQACERYHARNGVYPQTLDVLVPEYLKSVPPGFNYYVSKEDGSHAFWWTDIPPFHVRGYSFEKAKWSSFD